MSDHIAGIEHYGVADGNAIGWCGDTYNSIVGCTPEGPEWDNCYAAVEAVHQLVMRKGEGRYKGLAVLDGTTGKPAPVAPPRAHLSAAAERAKTEDPPSHSNRVDLKLIS